MPMAHPERPSPLQPSLADHNLNMMTQTPRYPGFQMQNHLGPLQLRTSCSQLPPIHSTPADQSEYSDGRQQVQLRPVWAPPAPAETPAKTTVRRSIPVAQLLTTDSPSPPRAPPAIPAKQAMDRRMPSENHAKSLFRYPPQPMSHQTAPPHRFEQTSTPFPQSLPTLLMEPSFPGEYCSRAQHHPAPPRPPLVPTEQTSHRFSPVFSTYSSPGYTHSETSPSSSIGRPSYSGAAPRPRRSTLPPLNFILSIRQQPAAARACGFGERDRRVVDPPPILELKITDQATGFPAPDPAGLLAMSCTLLSADGRDDETELPAVYPDMRTTQRLMGTLVASPYPAKDEHGIAGTFFVFPDLSCRSPGKYRLRFKLLRVEPMNMASGGRSVASMVTDVFNVYTAKDFPGMRASSRLLIALRKQGLNVGVKKGSEARKMTGKTRKEASSESDEESDDGESSSGVSRRARRRKRGKRRKKEA